MARSLTLSSVGVTRPDGGIETVAGELLAYPGFGPTFAVYSVTEVLIGESFSVAQVAANTPAGAFTYLLNTTTGSVGVIQDNGIDPVPFPPYVGPDTVVLTLGGDWEFLVQQAAAPGSFSQTVTTVEADGGGGGGGFVDEDGDDGDAGGDGNSGGDTDTGGDGGIGGPGGGGGGVENPGPPAVGGVYQLRLGPAFGGVPLPFEEIGVIDYFNVFSTCEVCFCPNYQPAQPPMAGFTQPTLTEPPTGGVPPQP